MVELEEKGDSDDFLSLGDFPDEQCDSKLVEEQSPELGCPSYRDQSASCYFLLLVVQWLEPRAPMR